MKCSICDEHIESCEHCNDFLVEGDDIICSEGNHVHEDCFNAWLQDTTNWDKGEVVDDDA